MPFVSIFERKAAGEAMEKGLKERLEKGEAIGMEIGREIGRHIELLDALELTLDLKFEAAGKALYEELKHVTEMPKLKAVLQAIRSASSHDELRKLL